MKHFAWFMLTLVSLKLSAQHSFGVQAGLNRSWQRYKLVTMSGTDVQNAKSIEGLQAGVWWQMQHNKRLSTAAALNYLTVGSAIKYLTEDMILRGITQPQYFRDRAGYLDMPLMVQYHIGRFYAGAGPGVGFWLYTRTKAPDGSQYIGSTYKPLDLSANGMVGVQVLKKMGIQVRYHHGLSSVYHSDSFPIRNRSVQASVTYQLLRSSK